LCHMQLKCDFDVGPQVLFDIFCHPGAMTHPSFYVSSLYLSHQIE
jgi:phenylalanine-4-hydroxylase